MLLVAPNIDEDECEHDNIGDDSKNSANHIEKIGYLGVGGRLNHVAGLIVLVRFH